jgi:hypothetical protein
VDTVAHLPFLFLRNQPMRNLLLACLPVLCFAPPLLAELKISGPASSPRDRLVELKAQGMTEKAQARWKVTGHDAQGKPLAPDVRKWKDRLLLVGPPGGYRVDLLVVDFDAKTLEEAEFSLTIGDPTPPTPPTPPVPPPPEDPFVRDLKAAYLQSQGTPEQKTTWLAWLIEVYKGLESTAQDKDVKTCEQLLTAMQKVVAKKLGSDDLKPVRVRIAAELAKRLPDDPDAPLKDADRAAASLAFVTVYLALEKCK